MKTIPENLLTSISKVAPLSGDPLELFINAAQKQIVKKGDYLLQEGNRCNHIWFVETGSCRGVHDNGNKEINTDFYFENTFITNLKSLRGNEPSAYNIQAMETSILRRWHKDELLALYGQSPDIAAFGRLWLEQLLIAQEAHMHWLKKYTPEERYQSVLSDSPELIQRVTLTQLSSYLGVSRETLSRIRRRIQ
ncbi:CRP-like cAMP-binding protein [Chitinophaga niastensis]|uniref:CRP-like cAMP-binding protein n=1 Tax=Chitinophaga niastensis TaxID=536980 RepID=A0A2P8HUB5_CHINA|nr:Crp/Fnr family transcriptional regulator [Chitinophaga niastensis]PSL49754.1 CRP-like cAMP-binding protein [Chitinophaga niastensis]